MRKKIALYPDLFCQYSIHEYSDELKKMSEILEQHEEILEKFRAGIESNISALKREFGLDRATWKGLSGYKSIYLVCIIFI